LDFKFIIIDDGSTDNSLSYLESLEDHRVVLLSQKNRGLGYTLNRLVELCDSELIARMDADDICYPARLERQIRFMERHKDVVMVGTGIEFLHEGRVWSPGPPLTGHELIVSRFRKKKFGVCHPSIMFRRKAFKKIGGYRVGGAGEDLDFFIRMSEIGKIENIPDVLLSYRIGNESLSIQRRDKLHLGYDYAIDCYKKRCMKREECSFEEFKEIWRQRNWHVRMGEILDDISERIYRKGIVRMIDNKRFDATFLFLLTALIRPHTAIERLRLRYLLKNDMSFRIV
jgi:glycosyltransferase involved in cell wall biosynthesis